jgi:hypothetical protein
MGKAALTCPYGLITKIASTDEGKAFGVTSKQSDRANACILNSEFNNMECNS